MEALQKTISSSADALQINGNAGAFSLSGRKAAPEIAPMGSEGLVGGARPAIDNIQSE